MSEDIHPVREDAERGTTGTGHSITDVPRTGKAERHVNGSRNDSRNESRNDSKGGHASGLERTMGAVRMLIPLLGKVLPLLDGNVAAVAASLLLPRLQAQTVDTYPLESALMKVRAELATLQDKTAEYATAFKRIDGQLESMKDAIDRSGAEQRETAENVRKIQGRVLVFSVVGLGLVAISIGVNVALFLYVRGAIH
jgi:hypothetical protein